MSYIVTIMKKLEIEIPDSLWRALEKYLQRSGASAGDVVCRAVSDYLMVSGSPLPPRAGAAERIDKGTVFQASATAALVEGVYRGAVSVGTLRQHGDLGIGTFEDLDGEMIIVDGACYQALSDGSVRPVSDTALTPYAVVARFGPLKSAQIDCSDYEELKTQCDSLRDSDNLFYAIRVTGTFDRVHLRVVCRTTSGTPLVEAAAAQAEFHFDSLPGTLVGFWSPQYARTLDVPGYHLHFLSADHQRGGHLLDCSGSRLQLEVDSESSLSMILPTNEAFLHADLTQDRSSALLRAESRPQKKERES